MRQVYQQYLGILTDPRLPLPGDNLGQEASGKLLLDHIRDFGQRYRDHRQTQPWNGHTAGGGGGSSGGGNVQVERLGALGCLKVLGQRERGFCL